MCVLHGENIRAVGQLWSNDDRLQTARPSSPTRRATSLNRRDEAICKVRYGDGIKIQREDEWHKVK